MPRTARSLLAGGHYHLINRGNNQATVFSTAADFDGFLRLIAEAQDRVQLRLLAACLMPNHFHVVAAQRGSGDISRWMHWLLTTHSHHHHRRHGSSGRVWQGRYKAFLIEQDGHLLTVMRYVERNALRAGLVASAEDWRWGSLHWRLGGAAGGMLALPPMPLPQNWRAFVNKPQTRKEVEAIRVCVNGERPYGTPGWTTDLAARLGRLAPARPRGRPRKASALQGNGRQVAVPPARLP